ncbi:MAG TPA: DAK2 domain-containing protein [candidate division Zixibacteria bacterium]|nr:DAK2 domain-containing protein [candidate division Zixibacteria bacterium]
MATLQLFSGETLSNMMRASANLLKKYRRHLNAINVFPVADGDTGANMYLTVEAIIEELNGNDNSESSIAETASLIARGSFMGATGNSGVILSQFFGGFSNSINKFDNIGPDEFSQAFVDGAAKAYEAVLNPQEGTILTVIRKSAEAANMAAKNGIDFIEMLDSSYEAAKETLVKTPELLPVLKKAGVVDAGGQGFVYIMEGWLKVFRNEDIEVSEEISEDIKAVARDTEEDDEYQFCTEFIIECEELNTEQTREMLDQFGGSLVVAKNDNMIRVHIHTNDPKGTIKFCKQYGAISRLKIDDMSKQHREFLFVEETN